MGSFEHRLDFWEEVEVAVSQVSDGSTGLSFVKDTDSTNTSQYIQTIYSLHTFMCVYTMYAMPLSAQLCKTDHAYFTYLTLKRQLSHLNSRKHDHQQV
jgi:hypothetical protein